MKKDEYKNRDDTRLVYYVINKMNLRYMMEELEDIGYIGLAQGYKTYKKEKGFLSTYLTVCIKNEINKFLQYKSCKKREGLTISLDEIFEKNKRFIDFSSNNFSYSIDKTLTYDILYNCISDLKSDYRNIIFQHYILGQSTLDIAKKYNQSRENIIRKMNYAKKELKKALIKNGITNGYEEE